MWNNDGLTVLNVKWFLCASGSNLVIKCVITLGGFITSRKIILLKYSSCRIKIVKLSCIRELSLLFSSFFFISSLQFLLLLLSHFSRVRLLRPHISSPPGSPFPGILQARTLEWVAISFSNAWKWKVKMKSLSRVGLLATLSSPPGSSIWDPFKF